MKNTKLTAALAAIALCAGNAAALPACAADDGWKTAYAAFLQGLASQNDGYRFMTVYVDNDDIPELVYAEGYDGFASHGAMSTVVTWCNGSVTELGMGDGFGEFYYHERQNLFCSYYSGMGWSGNSIQSIQNGSAVQEIALVHDESGSSTVYQINGKNVSKSAFNAQCKSWDLTEYSAPGASWDYVTYADSMVDITSANIRQYITDLAGGAALTLGDPNGDKSINASDAAVILMASARIGAGKDSGLTAAQETAANVNGDEDINASDAALILEYSALRGTEQFLGTMSEFIDMKSSEPEEPTKPEKPTEPEETSGLAAPVLGQFVNITNPKYDGSMYRISWEPVKGADGYEYEQYELSEDATDPYINTESTTGTFFTTGASVKNTVRFKVRAYTLKNGRRAYSDWSETRTITMNTPESYEPIYLTPDGLFCIDLTLLNQTYTQINAKFGGKLGAQKDFPYWGTDLKNVDFTYNGIPVCFMFQYNKLVMVIYDTFDGFDSSAYQNAVSFYDAPSGGKFDIWGICYYQMIEDVYADTGEEVLHQRYISNAMK